MYWALLCDFSSTGFVYEILCFLKQSPTGTKDAVALQGDFRYKNRFQLCKLWDHNFDPKNMNIPLGSFSENQADFVNSIGLSASDEWGHDNVGAMGTTVAATWLPGGSNSAQQNFQWAGEP